MGIKFNNIQALIDAAQACGFAVAYTHSLPTDLVKGGFDCTIIDGTEFAQRFIQPSYYNGGGGSSSGSASSTNATATSSTPQMGILTSFYVRQCFSDELRFLLHDNKNNPGRTTKTLVVLMDHVRNVPCIKSIEHERRQYNGCDRQVLVDQNVPVVPAVSGAAAAAGSSHHQQQQQQSFGNTLLWGPLRELWSTHEYRGVIANFFAKQYRAVLEGEHGLPKGVTCRPNFYQIWPTWSTLTSNNSRGQVADAAAAVAAIGGGEEVVVVVDASSTPSPCTTTTATTTTTTNILFGRFGTSAETTVMADVETLLWPLPGEADAQFPWFIASKYGKTYRLCSSDGDWVLHALAFLDTLHRCHYADRDDDLLPTIIMDRSMNASVRKSDKSPSYLDLTSLYKYLRSSGRNGCLATLAALLLSGNDYVPPFHLLEKFMCSQHIFTEATTTTTTTRTTATFGDPRRKGRKVRAVYGPKQLLGLSRDVEFIRCWDLKTGDEYQHFAVPVLTDEDGLIAYLCKRHDFDADHRHKCASDMRQNVRRLQWALQYIYGVPHICTDRFSAVERTSDGKARWGWRFVLTTKPLDSGRLTPLTVFSSQELTAVENNQLVDNDDAGNDEVAKRRHRHSVTNSHRPDDLAGQYYSMEVIWSSQMARYLKDVEEKKQPSKVEECSSFPE